MQWDMIWIKLFSDSDYSIEIIYNDKYGYPEVANNILSLRLKILPEDSEYTQEVLKQFLEKYREEYIKPDPYPNGKIIEEVGGDMIKGKVFQEE